jgi:hypothetical protein
LVDTGVPCNLLPPSSKQISFFLARGNIRSKKRPKHAARFLIRLIAWSEFLADGLTVYSAFLADGLIPAQLSTKSQTFGGIQS